MAVFVFSEKNEIFRELLQKLVKGIRLRDKNLIEAMKREYKELHIDIGYSANNDKVVLLAEGAMPCFFDAKTYDTIKEGEIVKA